MAGIPLGRAISQMMKTPPVRSPVKGSLPRPWGESMTLAARRHLVKISKF